MNKEVEKYLYSCKYPNSTNYISSIAELLKRINGKSIEVVCSEPLLLVESFDLFRKMYFFLNGELDKIDWGTVNDSLERFNELYAEIVLKDRNNDVLGAFKKLGFTEYRVYLRKNLLNLGKEYRELVETKFADAEDCSEIWDMLLKTFNPMCDRIPLQTELSELIANKSVLKVSINNEIAGVLLFQDSKSKSYVRCLCVREEYQNSVIGYSLMAKYFNLHLDSGIKLMYLWVDSENESVRKLHDRFGFKEDGTRNYIFRREVKR